MISPSPIVNRVTAAGLNTKSTWTLPAIPRLIQWEGLVHNPVLGTPAYVISKFGGGPIGIGSPTQSTHQWAVLLDAFGPKLNPPACHQTKLELMATLGQVSNLLGARTIVWDKDTYRIEQLETNFQTISDKGMLSLILWLRKL